MNPDLASSHSQASNIVWINTSPSLKRFDWKVLSQLSQSHSIAYWQYFQERDEASSLDQAVQFLHEYLQSVESPQHLVGHGMSGVVALLYARQYPQKVRSLTLLAVAAQPGVTWHSHYYVQRQLMPQTQMQLLAQMACSLFGRQLPYPPMPIVNALAKDLELAPSPHSLYQVKTLPEGGVKMPLMICSSAADFVVTPPLVQRWTEFFKPGDTLWQCPEGHHFFHHDQPDRVSDQLIKFWQQVQQRERLSQQRTLQSVV